jgi:hypothetical protein
VVSVIGVDLFEERHLAVRVVLRNPGEEIRFGAIIE